MYVRMYGLVLKGIIQYLDYSFDMVIFECFESQSTVFLLFIIYYSTKDLEL